MIEKTLDDIRDLIFKAMEQDLKLLFRIRESNENSIEDKKTITKSHARFFIIYGYILELFQNIDIPYTYNIPMNRRLKTSFEVENLLRHAIAQIEKQTQQDPEAGKNLLILKSKIIELEAIDL